MIQDVQIILARVAEKSSILIGNFTTNLAESWMAIRARFDGEKVINRYGSGSWYTRCNGGALRKTIGVAWSRLAFQNVTISLNMQRGKARNVLLQRNIKQNLRVKQSEEKRKLCEMNQSQSKKAKLHYGSSLDDSPDVDRDKLKEVCDNI